jgi:hypothetical protein
MKEIVGNLGTVRGAPTFEARHPEGAEPLAELEEQAGFADPRLARDPDDLAEALARAIQPLQQEPQLELPTHEGAETLPAKAEAGRLRPHEVTCRPSRLVHALAR